MAIREKKVGSKTLVVSDIINHIKNFKAVSSDRSFIDFVEKLEIIQLDLELFGHIKDMANTTNIVEIETRLPEYFRKY